MCVLACVCVRVCMCVFACPRVYLSACVFIRVYAADHEFIYFYLCGTFGFSCSWGSCIGDGTNMKQINHGYPSRVRVGRGRI